jgi:hypothetical protein
MPKEFSQFNEAGRKYAKSKKPADGRRTPRRDKQVARGKGFDQMAQSKIPDVRRAMGRGRTGKQYGKGEA